MGDIKKFLPNGNLAVIREDGSHIEIGTDGNVVGEKKNEPINKSVLGSVKDYGTKAINTIGTVADSFFPAVAKGMAFKSTDTPLSESVASPESSLQKTARKTGEYVGKAIPFGVAATGIGAPVEAAVTGAGLPLLADVAGGAATLGSYEGAKNLATKGLPTTGEKVGELTKDVALGTAFGAGLGAGNFVLGKVADFLGSKVPASLYNSIVRVTKGQALQDIKQGDYELIGGELANLPGFTGTKQTMISKATGKIDTLQGQIDQAIAPVANSPLIQTAEVIKPLEELSAKYNRPGLESRKQSVDELIASVKAKGPTLNVGDAQEWKKTIWSVIKDPEFAKSLEANPIFAMTQRLLGGGLRKEISRVVPKAATLNAEEGIYLGARQAIQEEIARDRGKLSETLLAAPAYEAVATRGAQVLRSTLAPGATTRSVASNVATPASGVGLSEMISNIQKKGSR